MNWAIEQKDLIGIAIGLLCGSVIGFEREYNNKSAGFRTIVLICLGSTTFTIVSAHGMGSDDRIAANIITGIGFIGAGVIFKDRLSVLGLTTAAVIWTVAGIGMLAGIGSHALALVLTAVTLIVLAVFHRVEGLLEKLHVSKLVHINFDGVDLLQLHAVENAFRADRVKFRRKAIGKRHGKLFAILEITGNKTCVARANEVLVGMTFIEEFYYN